MTYIREFLPFGLLYICYLRLKLGSVLERRADIRFSYDFVSTFIFGAVSGDVGHICSVMKTLNDSTRPTDSNSEYPTPNCPPRFLY